MAGYFEPQFRRLRERIDAAGSGATVWWRRAGFGGDFKNVTPKQHVFLSRARDTSVDEDGEPAGKWDFVYTGLCGYQYTQTEILFGPIVPTKGTPRVADRCRKCVKALAELKAAGKTVADIINAPSSVPDDTVK